MTMIEENKAKPLAAYCTAVADDENLHELTSQYVKESTASNV